MKATTPPLTFAFLGHRLVQGVAIETLLASLTALPLRVAEALQTAAGQVVAGAHRVGVRVPAAVAPSAGSNRSRLAQGVAVGTVLALLTAHTCRGLGEEE